MHSLRIATTLVAALGLGYPVVASASGARAPLFELSREPLSVQSCNTRCQSEQTDCALRCDGDVSCIRGCQKAADGCVAKCQDATRGDTPGQ
jgi:hypothetical protein